MKKLAVGLLIGLWMISAASAYLVTLQAPERIGAGETLNVTVVNTVPAGTTTDIVLYRVGYTKKEVARKTFTFQDEPVSLSFDTHGYTGGTYQVELVDPTGDTYGSSSTVRKMVEIVNRSADLILTSPVSQRFDGTLEIAGRVKDLGDRGVQITVENVNGVVYGPTYISTDSDGGFREEVPIEEFGTYRVDFSDYRGYITTVRFTVSQEEGTPTTAPTTGLPDTSATTIPTQPTGTAPATTPATPLPAVLALLAIAFAFLKRS